MLHRRHARLLRALQDAEDRGERPGYARLAELIGVKGTTTVFKFASALKRRGFVESVGLRPHSRLSVVQRIETITAGTPISDDPVVSFIHGYQVANDGASPTFEEISIGIGLASKSHIGERLAALERSGAVVLHGRTKRVMTMIQVVKDPTSDDLDPIDHEAEAYHRLRKACDRGVGLRTAQPNDLVQVRRADLRLLLDAPSDPMMRTALRTIADHTDPDDDESYRNDDREGCLDTVHALAEEASAGRPPNTAGGSGGSA